jgi:hypothetical protein
MCQAGEEEEFAQIYASWILFGLPVRGGLLRARMVVPL